MSRGPGLTGDRNFQDSVEFYKIGDGYRTVVYGKTREDVLAELQAAHGTSIDWEDSWIVTATRSVRMGLPPAWLQVPRRYDEYGERA
jgi:hypothetical protein